MSSPTLTDSNTVFFSTASDSYIFQSATSLLSVRKFLPNAKLFILSRYISRKNKRFLKKNKIDFVELDLTYLFFQTWEYPIECYYLFAGPKIFNNLGFKYSIYIDGDILCLKNPLDGCPEIKDIGGVAANKFGELFGGEKPFLSKEFRIPSVEFNKYRIHSGIIYMNNVTLIKLKLLEVCGDLFYKCWFNGCPRKGDDSLFALFQLSQRSKLSPVMMDGVYNHMPHYRGFQPNAETVFLHFTFDKPWKFNPYKHALKEHDSLNPYCAIWRKIARKTSLCRWFKTSVLYAKIVGINQKVKKHIIRIPFVLNGTRYSFFKKRHNLHRENHLKVYWWQPPHINNFGDIVTSDILLNIFGHYIDWSPIETCEMIATGSIMEVAQQQKHENDFYVWGTGFIRSNSGNSGLDRAIFSAVRGEKTKERIKKDVPTGDPGILINATYALKRKRSSKKIGVVIHYADMQTSFAKRFCEDQRFEVISPLDTPENVAKKIAQCGLVLSSSLHGLIFADSLSVPNIHIKISDNLTGGDYKFFDYYSGIGKSYEPADVLKIFDDDYLAKVKAGYKPIPKLARKQRSLIKSFPFK